MLLFCFVFFFGSQMFQARVACAPDQVIRYCFQDGATPLWPSPANLPALADIPPCKKCGAPRKFECQVSTCWHLGSFSPHVEPTITN